MAAVNTLYDRYRAGIRALIEVLGNDHRQLIDVLSYQHRLLSVMEDIERHGKSSDAAAELSRVIEQCNYLSLETTGRTFFAYCGLDEKGQLSADWQAALIRYRADVRQRYGTTRIFGQHTPVSLDHIFTDVYIHDRPLAFRRFDVRKLKYDPAPLYRAKRIPGVAILQSPKGHRLYILGKPGAGKTTFLKHLALENAKNEVGSKIPIFITLKDWADSGQSLRNFINEQFVRCGFAGAQPFLAYLLTATDDALVLFDGLDEITQEGELRARAIQDLRDFCQRYSRAQVLITCRVAATDYTFENFTYVEVADFTNEQISAFVTKWFAEMPNKGKVFLEELKSEQNRGLRELAQQPLLLALLCLAFNDTLTFSPRRVEIYYEALDALLRKWDSSRNIRRASIYEHLSVDRKHQLFAQLAALTFEEDEYFIPQAILESHISNYLRHIPGTGETLPDAQDVLQAIEVQHGILVERAHRIHAFAHLSFQEYYTARHVIDSIASGESGAITRLLAHAHNDRWREVILLTVSMLPNADTFFLFSPSSMIRSKVIPNWSNLWSGSPEKRSMSIHPAKLLLYVNIMLSKSAYIHTSVAISLLLAPASSLHPSPITRS